MKKLIYFITCMLFLGVGINSKAQTYYFKTTATGLGTGTSWDNAMAGSNLGTISKLVGDKTIYLAAGDYNLAGAAYTGNVNITDRNFSLIGGFPDSATGTDLSGYNPATNVTNLKSLASADRYEIRTLTGTGTMTILFKGVGFGPTSNGDATKAVVDVQDFPAGKGLNLKILDCNYGRFTNSITMGILLMKNIDGGSKTLLVDKFYATGWGATGSVYMFDFVNVNPSVTTQDGGAIANNPYIIQNSAFVSNNMGVQKGLVKIDNSNGVTVQNNKFNCNQENSNGFALIHGTANASKFAIRNNLFYKNTAQAPADANVMIINTGCTNILVDNNTFDSNPASATYPVQRIVKIDATGTYSNNKFDATQANAEVVSGVTANGNLYGQAAGSYNCPSYDDFMTCTAGSTAPPVSSSLSNVCPATTANLNSAHTGTIPSGAVLRWFTDNTHTTAVATPTSVVAGTYYAFYYDSTNNCYSPSSTAVTVTITLCCPAGNTAPTVN